MRNLSRSGVVLFCLSAVGLLTLVSPARSSAQASATASRSAGLSAFAGYVNSNPEYGSVRNSGEAFGVDFTKYLRLPINVSLEGRFNLTNGTNVSEHTGMGGIAIGTDILAKYRIHPYVDFLIGTGTIHFNTSAPGYTSDNSTVYDFGGGLNIDLVHYFQLKGDFQYQHWKLGEASLPFTPTLFLIGVTYQVHFRDYNRQGDLH